MHASRQAHKKENEIAKMEIGKRRRRSRRGSRTVFRLSLSFSGVLRAVRCTCVGWCDQSCPWNIKRNCLEVIERERNIGGISLRRSRMPSLLCPYFTFADFSFVFFFHSLVSLVFSSSIASFCCGLGRFHSHTAAVATTFSAGRTSASFSK